METIETVGKLIVLNKDVEGQYVKLEVSLQEGKVTVGDRLLIPNSDYNGKGHFTKTIEIVFCNGIKRTYIDAIDGTDCELFASKEGASLIKKGEVIKVGKGMLPPGPTQFRVAKSPM